MNLYSILLHSLQNILNNISIKPRGMPLITSHLLVFKVLTTTFEVWQSSQLFP